MLLQFLLYRYVCYLAGQVLILSEKLHSVTSQFDKLRAVRFQDAINRITPRKKLKQSGKENVRSSEMHIAEAREPNEVQDQPVRVHDQILDDETHVLQVSGFVSDGVSLKLLCYTFGAGRL